MIYYYVRYSSSICTVNFGLYLRYMYVALTSPSLRA